MNRFLVQLRQPALFVLIVVGTNVLLSQSGLARPSKAKPAIEAVLKVVAVVAAAEASREATAALHNHFDKTAAPGEPIYSVTFSFVRAIWSDFWSRPDVFRVVEMEGGEKLLIPDIEYDWDFGPKVFNFRCPTLHPGSQCVLRLYDDDSASNAIWKNILATTVTWKVNAGIEPGLLLAPVRGIVAMKAGATADGKLQILTANQASTLVLDAPDPMAEAKFTVPQDHTEEPWAMEGQFQSGRTDMGKVRFKHWYTNPVPSVIASLLRPSFVIWAVIVGVALCILGTRP